MVTHLSIILGLGLQPELKGQLCRASVDWLQGWPFYEEECCVVNRLGEKIILLSTFLLCYWWIQTESLLWEVFQCKTSNVIPENLDL